MAGRHLAASPSDLKVSDSVAETCTDAAKQSFAGWPQAVEILFARQP